MVKNLPTMREPQETWVQSLGWEDPLEEGMATHFCILPGQSPRTEEPGRLQSMGLQRVGHDLVTKHCTAHTLSQVPLVSDFFMTGQQSLLYPTRVVAPINLYLQRQW